MYVQYNRKIESRKIESRFKKRRELGRKFDPLALEDLEWTNEWIGDLEERFWSVVDIALAASEALEGRNFPRRARGDSTLIYTRRGASSTQDQPIDDVGEEKEDDNILLDDEDVEDDYGLPHEENIREGDGDHDDEMDDY